MISWDFFWIVTVMSGTWANRMGRHDDGDYFENEYLRSGKKYSRNMHSYQAGDGYNGYADSDRYYIARDLQKARDYQRDDYDRDGRSGANKYGWDNSMGQHYPAKGTYIKPTPATSMTTQPCTTPSCVTVTTSTTISRLVSICQLPTTYFYTGFELPDQTPTFVSGETGTCTLLPLPSKLIPGCCSCSTTASSSEPCFTSTFVRTVLKDKTCTMGVETFMYKHAAEEYYISRVNMATTCAV